MTKPVHTILVVAVLAVLASLLLAGWTTIQSTTPTQPRQITVSGDAEVRVVPDEVILTLGVETDDMDLLVAKAENDQRVARILALAEEHGIETKHVQTEYIHIEPRYESSYQKREFIGYFVQKTVALTLRKIDDFESLLTDVLTGGATHVQGIQFRTTALREHKDRARALALEAAGEKAAAMAGALGQQIGEPVSIQENQTGWWSPYGGWWGSSWGGSIAQNVIQNAASDSPIVDGTLAPGQISVYARVTVTFALQ
jgi:uncharacterized protein YggE